MLMLKNIFSNKVGAHSNRQSRKKAEKAVRPVLARVLLTYGTRNCKFVMEFLKTELRVIIEVIHSYGI